MAEKEEKLNKCHGKTTTTENRSMRAEEIVLCVQESCSSSCTITSFFDVFAAAPRNNTEDKKNKDKTARQDSADRRCPALPLCLSSKAAKQ